MSTTPAFGDRLTELLNASAISTALGVASRCGLLKALDETPRTASELAVRGHVSERYTEEILAVLATGDVVTLEPPATTSDSAPCQPRFSLSRERQEALKGMGLYFEEMPTLCQAAFEGVCDAASTSSGTVCAASRSDYSQFSAWMGKLSDEKLNKQLVQQFLPLLHDGKIVEQLSKQDGDCYTVLDFGCGQGTAAMLIAKAFPHSRVYGVDIDGKSIDAAKAAATIAGLNNVEFVRGDIVTKQGLPVNHGNYWESTFDLILSFDVIHDLSDPIGALSSLRTMLKDSGSFAMVDIKARSGLHANISHPMASFLYGVSLMHCLPQGLRDHGAGLGMMWGREKAMALISQAKFSKVDLVPMEFDAFNELFLCRK